MRRVLAMTLGLVGLIVVAPSQATSADESPLATIATAPASTAISLDTFKIAMAPSPLALMPMRFERIALPSFELEPPQAPARVNPYGLELAVAPAGALWTKWRQVVADVDDAAPALEHCRKDFRRCSPAARRFVALIKQAARAEGRTRLAIVNRAVNAAVTYTSDADQWHRDDVWSAPFDSRKTGSFETGKGDCEDYAVAKYVALRGAGVAADDLQVLVVKDTTAGIDHAVLAARFDGRWLILDNRWSRLLEEDEAAFFKPLFALDAGGVRRFSAPEARTVRLRPHQPAMPLLYIANRA
ncbi:MAG: transglutaminase-like cysteine peptidase [Proteobacteria bacterium]|nr:transglutaminase-like cysteine peptidase [Pseudomonadota bacterium]